MRVSDGFVRPPAIVSFAVIYVGQIHGDVILNQSPEQRESGRAGERNETKHAIGMCAADVIHDIDGKLQAATIRNNKALVFVNHPGETATAVWITQEVDLSAGVGYAVRRPIVRGKAGPMTQIA